LGEVAAFDQLVSMHTPKLYQVVRRMTPDSGEAEAIVQETWLRAWKALSRFREEGPMRPWLMTIATNITRDRWRKKEPLQFVDLHAEEEGLPDSGPTPEVRMTRKEALDRLGRGVENLRPKYRAVIALRYDAGLSYQEIANTLGIPLNTVRTHLRRAKSILRSWMEAEDDRSVG
jgi:RNA polymerase sigma-70 factor (ECF subfamily)